MATKRPAPALRIALAAACAAGLFGCSDPKEEAASPSYNVVLISIDTCRADHLSCYGAARRTTPNIDAIASEGVLFTRAQSTNPVTLPSHCSMLTGTSPVFHGVHHNLGRPLDESNLTLAEILREHGYETAAVVGAFPLHARFGLSQGFDHYDQDFGGSDEKLFFSERKAEAVTAAGTAWIESHHTQPFFLFLHYFDPHHPYEPPEPFATTFGDDRYAGEIAYTDASIGQVIATLKHLDLLDSTLLVITADHGESLGEHDEDSHGFFIYQGTIHVPLIIRPPGGAAGRKVDEPAGLIDIVPTVLGLLNLEAPDQVQGVNWTRVVRGSEAQTVERDIYSESWTPASFGCAPLRGLVQGRWRFIDSLRPELYDLSRDPGETSNLVEARKKVAQAMQRRLREILADARSVADDTSAPDHRTIAQIQSLGYAGGVAVDIDMKIHQDMEDPKDFIGAFKQYMLAQHDWGRGALDEGADSLRQILSERPKLLPARLLLGTISAEQGDTADAIEHYSRVLAVAAEASDPAVHALEVYQAHIHRADAHGKLGLDAQALADLNRAIELSPTFAGAWSDRGIVHARMGRHDEAMADYDRAIELDPESGAAWGNRASAHLDRGRIEAARADFARAIELDPDNATTWYNRGNLHLQTRRLDPALADFSRAIELDPRFAEACHNRGIVYRELGRQEPAVADLSRAIELRPDFAQAWRNRGVAHGRMRRVQRALADFARSIELDANSAETHVERAIVLGRMRQYPEALSDYGRAIELDPQHSQAHANRAAVHVQMGRHETALADLSRAIELKPAYGIAWYNRGNVHLQMGRHQPALDDYARALELRPQDARVHNTIAWVRATSPDVNVRDGQIALSAARRALELSGRQDIGILQTLAAAHAEARQFDEAVKWQNKALALSPPNAKEEARSRLKLYEKREPYRQPTAASSTRSTEGAK